MGSIEEAFLAENSEGEPYLSLVIPTRNEAENIKMLLSQLRVALDQIPTEIIFVDDSDDNTAETIRATAPHFPFNTRLIQRPPERRANGLGGAVVEGFRIAQAEWMGVMDADLQHPPHIVPRMLETAVSEDSDIILGTRLGSGGDTSEISTQRNVIAHTFALLTRLAFPMRLWRISDPLTGLFLLRNSAVDLDILRPDGFKILLEILVRSPLLKVTEVPFRFESRHGGESKANSNEVLRLLRHFVRLRYSADTYLVRFLLVGVLGLILNTLLMWLGVGSLRWPIILTAILATELTTLSNFVLNEQWVFDDRRERKTLTYRLRGFFLMNNVLLALRLPLLLILITLVGLHYLLANFISLIAMTIVRFFISDQIIWERLASQPLNRE